MTQLTDPADPEVGVADPRAPIAPWRHRLLHSSFGRVVVMFLVVTTLVSPLVAFKIHREHSLSPLDEVEYLDYVNKVDHGHFVIGKGERVGSFASRVEACRGVPPLVPVNPAICSGRTQPPYLRYNGADIDPPTYYVLTAVAARVIRGVGITPNLLTSARLVGALWAGLGLTMLFLFARRLGASWRVAALVTGVAACLPLDLDQWTYVTPHALEFPVAISAAWIAVNWAEGRGHWWHLAAIGLVAPLVKATSVLGVGIAILFLLSLVVMARERSWAAHRHMLYGSGLLIAGLGVSSVAWLLVRSHYSLISGNEFPLYNVHSFRVQFLTTNLGAFVRPATIGGATTLGLFIGVLVFGLPLRFLHPSQELTQTGLAAATLTAGLVGPWLFVLSNYVLLGQYVPLPVRYGLAVLAVALALSAAATRGRVAEAVLVGLLLLLLSLQIWPQYW